MAIDKAVDSAKLDAKFSAIADAIRAKTGKTETMTEDEMPTKVDEVFAAGEKSECDRFWDAFQKNGAPGMYNYAFYGPSWTSSIYEPKHDVVVQTTNGLMSTFALSDITNIKVVVVGEQADWNNTFHYCRSLTTIPKIVVGANATYTSTFRDAISLANLTVEGTIGQNGFDVHWSTLLTHDSLMSIINALADYSTDTSGTEWKVTLGDENLAKLSEAEIGIAEGKGWVLA